jgi:tyrosinase
MVDRFVTAPLELPGGDASFERADLIFYGLDHAGASYEARVFLDAPDATHETGRDHPAYAGSFYIFGHGGCFGDEGHCDVPVARDPFDIRAPHQLEPALRILTVTPSIDSLVKHGSKDVVVTVVAHATRGHDNSVLAFDTVRLATYEG